MGGSTGTFPAAPLFLVINRCERPDVRRVVSSLMARHEVIKTLETVGSEGKPSR
ncbi:hypothetical protein [Streptomyces sp. NBC_00388]|uniref:hypothetical protein n=1 Tax=Streptomyces sp. NBC_00388 TaxID=2975735 RepID=UPI002E1F555B